jgi:hypothetical protein
VGRTVELAPAEHWLVLHAGLSPARAHDVVRLARRAVQLPTTVSAIGLVFSFAFFDHMAGKTRTYQTPDGRTVTGRASETDTLVAAPDLSLLKDDGVVSAVAGQTLTYGLTFRNDGNRAIDQGLGGDAAISIALSPGRTLWLFGDTFIASPNAPARATALSSRLKQGV